MATRNPLVVVAGALREMPTGDVLPSADMPLVSNPIRSGSVSTSLTSDASSGAGNLINLQITGDATINPPSNPTDYQELRHHCVAVGADRKVTFGAGYSPTTGIPLGPYVIPRGKVLVTRSEYIGNRATAADVAAPAWALVEARLIDTSDFGGGPPGNLTPALHGALAWTTDPIDITGGTSMTVTGGVIYLFKVQLIKAATLTGAVIRIQTAGATQTQGYVGLYDSAGNLVAVSANQTTAWQSTGDKTIAFTAPVTLASGTYFLAFLSQATTPARPLSSGAITTPNMNLSAGNHRTATSGTAQTALPSTITLGSAAAGTAVMLALLY